MPPSAENVLSSFLGRAGSTYRHPDQTKRDVQSLLHHYKGLTPKPDKFMFNDGRERELLHLQGTIPVPYKGQTYNIPISLWLLDTHPYHAPLAFVKPTADMQVKVSKHVDAAGKIYLPYLHEWSHPNSDLLGLVQICIVTFSEQPPVFAKPKQQQPQFGGLPYPVAGQQGSPGYPTQPGYPVQQQPAYPPYPPANSYGGPQPGFPPAQPGYPPAPAAAGPGYPPAGPGGPGYPTANPPAYPPYPAAGGAGGAARPGTGTITADHIQASILSAVEDKVRRRVREEYSQGQAECDSLQKTKEELTAGGARLAGILARIQQEDNEINTSIRLLESKRTEMSAVLDKLETGAELDPDEAVAASCPLFRQLMAAYAEESATEDSLYFLGEALRKGALDAEVFLKQVRELSRKQFMLRATMTKCRERAGLKQ